MVFEIFKTKRQLLVRKPTFKTEFYFRLVGRNGEVLAQSEGYTQKHNIVQLHKRYFYNWEKKDLT